jgi:hypothetical protein
MPVARRRLRALTLDGEAWRGDREMHRDAELVREME